MRDRRQARFRSAGCCATVSTVFDPERACLDLADAIAHSEAVCLADPDAAFPVERARYLALIGGCDDVILLDEAGLYEVCLPSLAAMSCDDWTTGQSLSPECFGHFHRR